MQPVQPLGQVTTKQMLQASTAFKVTFYGTILLTVAIVVLGIVAGSVQCEGSHSCYWWYGSNSYSNQCYSYNTYYCCRSGWSYCGDYYCTTKPDQICWGVLIALWVCAGVGFFFAIALIIVSVRLKRRIRNGLLYGGGNFVQVQPYGYNPGYQQQPIYYAQPQAPYQQPNYAQPQNYAQPGYYQPPYQQPVAQEPVVREV
jgi:hypothetical protein